MCVNISIHVQDVLFLRCGTDLVSAGSGWFEYRQCIVSVEIHKGSEWVIQGLYQLYQLRASPQRAWFRCRQGMVVVAVHDGSKTYQTASTQLLRRIHTSIYVYIHTYTHTHRHTHTHRPTYTRTHAFILTYAQSPIPTHL